MMGKTQQGGRFYDSHHDDLHGVRGGGAEPGHTAAAGRYRRTGTLTQVDVDKFSICLHYRNLLQFNHFQTPVITLFSEQLEVDKCRKM